MSAFGFLFFPGHVKEWTLDVIVDDCKPEQQNVIHRVASINGSI